MCKQGPKATCDLRRTEQQFLRAMQELGYGRFESLRILQGELVLEPWPTTVRSVKFANPTPNRPVLESAEFELKCPITEFFAQVRLIRSGLIRVLEVRGGLPFSMDLTDVSDQ